MEAGKAAGCAPQASKAKPALGCAARHGMAASAAGRRGRLPGQAGWPAAEQAAAPAAVAASPCCFSTFPTSRYTTKQGSRAARPAGEGMWGGGGVKELTVVAARCCMHQVESERKACCKRVRMRPCAGAAGVLMATTRDVTAF